VRFLSSRAAVALTVLLLAQGALFYAVASRPEQTATVAPLETFPSVIGGWQMTRDVEIEKDIQDVLKASDILERIYVNPSLKAGVNLFIAYFQTQRTGAAPHSPKNCLPGSGWEPVETPGRVSIAVSGWPALVVNRYVVARGDQRSVVLYWYQSHNRVIASEFDAKFWLVADSIRYRRSDTALVKVVVPVADGDAAQAVDTAVRFVQAAFPALVQQLPG